MTVEFPIAAMALLVHVAIYISSLQPDKRFRFGFAVALIVLALVIKLLPPPALREGQVLIMVLAILQDRALILLAFLSFLVYLRPRAGIRKH